MNTEKSEKREPSHQPVDPKDQFYITYQRWVSKMERQRRAQKAPADDKVKEN